jgi:hypothetical protein
LPSQLSSLACARASGRAELALKMPPEYYQCNTNTAHHCQLFTFNRLFQLEKSDSQRNGMQQAWLFSVTGTILDPYWSDHHKAQGVWGL